MSPKQQFSKSAGRFCQGGGGGRGGGSEIVFVLHFKSYKFFIAVNLVAAYISEKKRAESTTK